MAEEPEPSAEQDVPIFTQEGQEGTTEPGDEEEEILDLIDATNDFNMLSRYGMLWTIHHRWPKMARFAFNCYRHQAHLVCQRRGQEALILLSKEGVTQGNPLAMALYGVALLPLAEMLRNEFPHVLQPWYADNAAMVGKARLVAACLKRLMVLGRG